ncbi:hypothetical protein LJR225_003554 [Phenylobacterium sp. LjRoot225]|uniref:hypothetical protein n=1 Tax=Phenylobacterium sp. LjRoot225 TaxID=3342285 RepID=UPI003ECF7BB8
MKRAFAGIWLALAVAGGPAAFAQTNPPSAIPPLPVVVPGPPGPHVESPGKLPEPPKTVPDLAYDSRIISSAASAEQFQGPLDGGWTLARKKKDLYALQLVDKQTAVEGAWRDPRRSGDPSASGVLEMVQRAPPGLLIRFTPTGQAPVTVRLRPDLHGELEQDGKRTKVTLRRMPKVAAARSLP